MTDKKDEVEAMLENTSMERMQDYLMRGRGLAHLTADAVADFWIMQMNLWADKSNKFSYQILEDCNAEMRLRKIEPPFDRIESAFKKIVANSKARTAAILEDPKQTAALESRLETEIERLRGEAKKKPKN